MHATLATFDMGAGSLEDQRVGLETMVVPGVKKAPGFISGHWVYDHATKKSHALLVFETESDASRMVTVVRGNAENQARAGVVLESIVVTEVIVRA